MTIKLPPGHVVLKRRLRLDGGLWIVPWNSISFAKGREARKNVPRCPPYFVDDVGTVHPTTTEFEIAVWLEAFRALGPQKFADLKATEIYIRANLPRLRRLALTR